MVTPANATLVRDLTLSVPCGTNLLVTGPNGSGKSSLFRVLGGLWPLTEGKMCKPGGQDGGDGLSHDIFYVPQRPYVTIGTLPDQLIYPLVQQGTLPFPFWKLPDLFAVYPSPDFTIAMEKLKKKEALKSTNPSVPQPGSAHLQFDWRIPVSIAVQLPSSQANVPAGD